MITGYTQGMGREKNSTPTALIFYQHRVDSSILIEAGVSYG
jgi:hypothetical protein